jgi:Protein of unknown function (DUF2009)
LNPGLIALCF